MQVELVHVSAGGRVEPKTLAVGEYVLGRDKGCALRVPSGQVSRRHCVFEVFEHGIAVRDLKSSNGTWVNAVRVTDAQLEAGDLVAVGPLVFVIRVDGEPETIDPVLLYEQGRPRVEDRGGMGARPPMNEASGSAGPVTSMAPLVDPEGSSIIEFDFDASDDDDDQPPL